MMSTRVHAFLMKFGDERARLSGAEHWELGAVCRSHKKIKK
jgi:hypothetical protein